MSADLTESFQYFNFSYIKCIFLRFEYFLHFFDSDDLIVGDIQALVDRAERSRAYLLQNLVLAEDQLWGSRVLTQERRGRSCVGCGVWY
jgi:hypothetical protein